MNPDARRPVFPGGITGVTRALTGAHLARARRFGAFLPGAGGVRAHRFTQRIPETKPAGELPAVPPELLGRPEGGPAVPVDRYYEAEGTFWADPRTGAPIDQRQHVLSTLRPRQGPGAGVLLAAAGLPLTARGRRSPAARPPVRPRMGG
ncbi:DUF3068 domain-containing protein [Actinomadura sp. NAK00032]|uniref:porin PorA family protein n=1 Tax=Actinomadura sp. NAK00032 TaxID=2742128 RepID=UPI001591B41B|nr:porin PorA family protein [Actinomadura sp. NAK00032]QKW36454.1 DUF3068 domain-containing protein [Actinomadura sp. NAK00032]